MGCYRKRHPNELGISPGTESPTFNSNETTFGVNICNDANFPEESIRLAQRGAQIIFFPLNNMLKKPVANKWRTKTIQILKSRALETSCWVVSSDIVGENNGRISYGATTLITPHGTVEKRVPEMTEGHIIFDIQL